MGILFKWTVDSLKFIFLMAILLTLRVISDVLNGTKHCQPLRTGCGQFSGAERATSWALIAHHFTR